MAKEVKTNKLLFLGLIVFIILGIATGFVVKTKILIMNTEVSNDSIFIPKGIADNYKDYLMFSFDDYRIWEYELNAGETAAVEKDINNGIWQKPTKNQCEEIIGVFFMHGLYRNNPDEFTENFGNIFYCIYDNTLDRFIKIDEGASLGWHRELFIYDKADKTYISVSMGI